MKRYIFPILILLAGSLLYSCAKETSETSESVQKRILAAYVQTHYPDVSPSESGLYILERVEGTGDLIEDSTFIFVHYSIRTLDGTYASTSYEDVAKRIGYYSATNYYGPRVWSVADQTAGIREIVMGMKSEGFTKSIIPPWLLDLETGNTITGDGVCEIYDIHILDVVDDITDYQIDTLESFAAKYYPRLDSTKYGFYFQKIFSSESDTIADETTVSVRYIGKYLDGKVFDTNIADSAKKYHIYSSSNTYDALSVQYFSDEATFLENASVVDGFARALNRMKYGDIAVTFFFSDMGYGDAGTLVSTGSGMPPYTPLFFKIWVEDDDD